MAAVTEKKESRVSLKLLVDEKRNRVLLAEASKEFVDILFGFLTLPMGTIVRIIRKQEIADSGVLVGMNHLYQSVEDLGDDSFCKQLCKSSLLNPRNPFEEICMSLKVKIDESSPDKYYNCSRCGRFSKNRNRGCCCGGIFNGEKLPRSEGVFFKGGMSLIVSDDLQVRLNSPSSLAQHLSNLGITDITEIREMSVEAGVEEISSLLKCSLISKSPLTDVFLVTQAKSKNPNIMLERRNLALPSCEASYEGTSTCRLSLKLVLSKSTNGILCAEASDDVVNFLFNFLTIPLGSVMTLLHGQTGLGCIDNLHKSVEKLENKWLCIKKDRLLDVDICRSQLLSGTSCRRKDLVEVFGGTSCRSKDLVEAFGDERPSGKFVKIPSLFLVSDSLVVRDLSSTSSIGFFKELNISVCDIEERTVTIGETEALGILKASLTSSSALGTLC